jgi:hypothetical protein
MSKAYTISMSFVQRYKAPPDPAYLHPSFDLQIQPIYLLTWLSNTKTPFSPQWLPPQTSPESAIML